MRANSTTPRSRTLALAGLTMLAAALSLIALLAIPGCSPPARPRQTATQLQERAATEAELDRQMFSSAIGRVLVRAQHKVEAASDSSPANLDILALSGGGDYGAFGAGFLVGWGSAPDPEFRRPDFDAVTGVSTGAMLAPFAYVGTDEPCRTVESFYRNPREDWVESRGLLFFLPTNPSFMVIRQLEQAIQTAIDKPLVERMAEQSRRGKLLIISATDLDLGRQKVWNVGMEAESAVASGNLDRLHRILMASAAIPAFFPAVELDGSLYADGGVTANVLLRLDPHSPDGFLQRWMKSRPATRFGKVRYWIIINNQLSQRPETAQPTWPAVISPSLATAIRSATIAEVRWLAAQVDYVNAVYHTDIEVYVTAIPDDWRPPVPGDFQKETMESLAELGRRMGADPKSWRRWSWPTRPETLEPGRPSSAVPNEGEPLR